MRIPVLAVLGTSLLLRTAVLPSERGDGPVTFRVDTLERTYGRCGEPGGPCVTLRVEYPVFLPVRGVLAGDALNVFVQETLLGKYDPRGVAPVLEAVLDTVARQFREATAHDSAAARPWTIERRIGVVGDTMGILTMRVREYRNTGGAHPIAMHLLYMVETSSARVLALEDLVPAASMERLRRFAERSFRKVRRLGQGASLAKAGFQFREGVFAMTMNAGLVPGGLLLYYNPYEIAPYAMGPTEVVVPWKDAGPLLQWTGSGR